MSNDQLFRQASDAVMACLGSNAEVYPSRSREFANYVAEKVLAATVDGQAWEDLEAERDRLSEGLRGMARRASDMRRCAAVVMDYAAARSAPGAPAVQGVLDAACAYADSTAEPTDTPHEDALLDAVAAYRGGAPGAPPATPSELQAGPDLGVDASGAAPGADTALVARVENLRTHIGNVGDYREAVIARLDELGDISRALQRLAARSPLPSPQEPPPAGGPS